MTDDLSDSLVQVGKQFVKQYVRKSDFYFHFSAAQVPLITVHFYYISVTYTSFFPKTFMEMKHENVDI